MKLILGLIISFILIISPFVFYLYKYAPAESEIWETKYFTVTSGGFNSVQIFVHQLFTKITFVIITSLWFLTCKHWWRWAILVPLVMFLFQLSGVINFSLDVIDEFSFWKSLPIITPIIILHIYLANKLKVLTNTIDLKEQIDQEINTLIEE